MNIGDLRYRITLQQKNVPQTNENGFVINDDGFSDWKTLWASINNLFGNEFWSAKAVQSEDTIEFVVRYSQSLEQLNTKDYRIIWKEKVFDIIFIDNIKYENKWLKIKAKEVS